MSKNTNFVHFMLQVFFLTYFWLTNTSCAIPYFSDFIIYILWLLIKTFYSKKLTYYIHVFNYIYTYTHIYSCCLVAQSCPTLCDPMDCMQHVRLPCPLASPRAFSNSWPLSQWCRLTISSSVVPVSSCLQSFPASVSFLMSWLFASGGQNIGVSASVLAMNIQD